LAETKAVEKLEQLADQKVPEAMHLLGQLLWEGSSFSGGRGKSVPATYRKQLKWDIHLQ
jgi:hypothetical protein